MAKLAWKGKTNEGSFCQKRETQIEANWDFPARAQWAKCQKYRHIVAVGPEKACLRRLRSFGGW
jgi:hypothetical protein